jgi:tetratricopeptide (TPR) repeat protein
MAAPGFSLDYFAEGERMYRANRPEEAIPLLYQASLLQGTDPRVYVYLGFCYTQIGKYDDAVSVYVKGTSVAGADRKTLFFNAGLVFFKQGKYSEAVAMYSRVIDLDSSHAAAFLNRANARVGLGTFADAISDYTMYIMLDPASPKRESIERLIELLRAQLKSQEDEAARAEAARVAAAAEKKAAEERYQKMMDEVSSSLQSIDEASTLSAGSENIMDYDEEGQLE